MATITCGEFGKIVNNHYNSTGKYISFEDALLEMGLKAKHEFAKAKRIIVPELKSDGVLRPLVLADKVRPTKSKKGRSSPWVYNDQYAEGTSNVNALVIVAENNTEIEVYKSIDRSILGRNALAATEVVINHASSLSSEKAYNKIVDACNKMLAEIAYLKHKLIAATSH